MFTNVLQQASNIPDKDETQMSSLKLQIDPVLSAFNEILSNEIKSHSSGSSPTGVPSSKSDDEVTDLIKSLQCVLECSLQVAKIDDWAGLVATHLVNPALILSRLRGLEEQSSRSICTGRYS